MRGRTDGVGRADEIDPGVADLTRDLIGSNERLKSELDELRSAQDAIRTKHEEHLKLIVDTIPALVWSARPDGSADFFNEYYLAYTGLTAEACTGWGWTVAVHPEDISRLTAEWYGMMAAGAPGEVEARLRRADGEYRWLLFRTNPLRDQSGHIVRWYGTNIDIEDRKRADAAQRASDLVLRKIIDALPTAAWSTRPDGYCDFLNRSWLDYAGFTMEQAEGWAWGAAIHPEDAKRLAGYWQEAIVNGTAVDIEARLRRFDGVYHTFVFRANPLRDETGQIVRWYGINLDIEDRKQAEIAVKASELSLRQLTETLPAMLWSAAPDGAIDYCNTRFLNYTGISADTVSAGGWLQTIHPDDVDRARATWAVSISSGEPFRAELRTFSVEDQSYRWCEVSALPLLDEQGQVTKWHGTVWDIHDWKVAQEGLLRSEASLAEAQRVSSTGSFSWRLKTDEIEFSRELKRIYEFDENAAVTIEMVNERAHPEDTSLVSELLEQARTRSDEMEYETRLKMPNGSVKHLRTIAHTVTNDEDGIVVLGAVMDTTERKLSEAALDKVRSDLTHLARATSLGALTASIAHEINQPITGIITNAGTSLRMLAAEPPDIEGAVATAQRTIRDGNRAAEVIARLRSLFARKEFAVEEIDLNEATKEVIALLSSELLRNRVTLHANLAPELPHIMGDRVQIQQVILNLLLNASDSVSSIDDRTRAVDLCTALDVDGHVRLTVKDMGPGFDPQDVDKLFEAFYTTKKGGMGVGLSISRSIIESHKGRLWGKINDGPGATFSFAIPYTTDPHRQSSS